MLWELKRSLQINQLPITCKIVPDWLPLSLDSTQVSCSELSTNDGPSRNLFEYTALAKCKTLVSHFWEITSGNCMRTRTKAPANDLNISTQHVATLLGETCCVRDVFFMLEVVASNLKIVKFFMQHLRILHDVVVV